MSGDIGPLLESWPYDPHEELMVRQIVADDGTPRIQVRIELGLLELRPDGRPDGYRPNGFDSLLDYYADRVRQEGEVDDEKGFKLDSTTCGELQREAMQYYHRRISYLSLGDWEAAAADAEHNLAIMDLLRDRAADREDWLASEQYRAFVLTHRTRARMQARLEVNDVDGAVAAVDEGIGTMERLFRDEYGRADLIDQSEELQVLRDLRRDILRQHRLGARTLRRESPLERLQRELDEAVQREDFERAARLRDALHRLQKDDGS